VKKLVNQWLGFLGRDKTCLDQSWQAWQANKQTLWYRIITSSQMITTTSSTGSATEEMKRTFSSIRPSLAKLCDNNKDRTDRSTKVNASYSRHQLSASISGFSVEWSVMNAVQIRKKSWDQQTDAVEKLRMWMETDPASKNHNFGQLLTACKTL